MGFLGPADRIVMNSEHLLMEAKREALAMVSAGYRPEPAGKVWAAGRDALANLKQMIWSMREAGYATEHDAVVAGRLAHVLTGGDLSRPGWVPEQHILDLEREAFQALSAEPKTHARMWHMLQHRKPLRN
jgi:3-hydroxyacyl-CoA dehydrogenase